MFDLVSGLGAYLVAGLIAAGGVLAALWGAKRAGHRAERAKQDEHDVQTAKKVAERDESWARSGPGARERRVRRWDRPA